MYTSAHSRTPSSDPSGGRTMMLPRFPSSDGDGGGDMPAGVGPFAIREGPEFGRMEGDVRGNGLGDERNRQRRSGPSRGVRDTTCPDSMGGCRTASVRFEPVGGGCR